MLLFGSEERMRQKGRTRFFGSWNLPKRSCQVPGPVFKRQMVDLAVPTINIHALARLIEHGPEASGAGDMGLRYCFACLYLDFRKDMGPPKIMIVGKQITPHDLDTVLGIATMLIVF